MIASLRKLDGQIKTFDVTGVANADEARAFLTSEHPDSRVVIVLLQGGKNKPTLTLVPPPVPGIALPSTKEVA